MIAFLLIVLIVAGTMLVVQKNQATKQGEKARWELVNLRTKSETEAKELQSKISFLEEEKKQLEKYQVILDAEAKAKEVISEAEASSSLLLKTAKEESDALLMQAKSELEQAKIQSKDTRFHAQGEADGLKAKAEELMKSSTIEAQKILAAANIRAEEIAGKAYFALKNATQLEQTATAMKNIIEGYGDKYIVPSFNLLDHLAEEYSHTEAGIELKNARERMRLMVSVGTAAKCNYVEVRRRDTAILFVLDAFNGKVDSILSTLKHTNHGILSQKIKDAFSLVNHNGSAFRDAVITEEYLNTRLEELKWAATVQELKWKEHEEQREIKEQIREEEKARRDFERAMKDAAKQEELIKKAMEKIQKDILQANDQQKAKYEAQLTELNERLKTAEEKNQRALSMAQQTKSGHVYVISNIGSFGDNVYKVGMTRRLEPLDRVMELGNASVPFEFDVHAMIMSEDAPSLERALHKKFLRMQLNKVNPRKEFFRLTLADIKTEIESLGITAKWTMAADAKHYKESLAIEKAMHNNTINQQDWIEKQMENLPTAVEVLEEEGEEEPS
jgi:hypothetical protein